MMAAESLLNRSWSALDGSWSRLGALKIASRWPDTVRGEVGGRSGGGKVSIFGWPWPLGAPLIKENRLITTTNTNFMQDLNTPWAKGPANLTFEPWVSDNSGKLSKGL